jgi:hypothetical protein
MTFTTVTYVSNGLRHVLESAFPRLEKEIKNVPTRHASFPLTKRISLRMVGRSLRSANNDAKRQSTSSVNVKTEQVKKEIIKDETLKTPRVASINGDAAGETVADGDEAEVDELEGAQDDAEGSPRGHKRARVDEDGNSVQGNEEEEVPLKAKPRIVTLPRDDDG